MPQSPSRGRCGVARGAGPRNQAWVRLLGEPSQVARRGVRRGKGPNRINRGFTIVLRIVGSEDTEPYACHGPSTAFAHLIAPRASIASAALCTRGEFVFLSSRDPTEPTGGTESALPASKLSWWFGDCSSETRFRLPANQIER